MMNLTLIPKEKKKCGDGQRKLMKVNLFLLLTIRLKRPMYTYPDPNNPDETLSFDVIGRGQEWITGGTTHQ